MASEKGQQEHRDGNELNLGTDFWCVAALLGVFTLAVMSDEIVPVEIMGKAKWGILLGFAAYVVVRRQLSVNPLDRGVPLLLGLFLVVTMLSTLNNYDDFEDAFSRLFSFCILYLLACGFPVPREPAKRLATWTTVALVLSAGIVILSLLPGVPGAFAGHRLRGVTGNANTLGTYA